MEIKTIYIAEDGTEFSDEKECLIYENEKLKRKQAFKNKIKAFNSGGKPLDTSSKNWFTSAYTIKFEDSEVMHEFARLLQDGEQEEIDAYDPDLGEYLWHQTEPVTMRYIEALDKVGGSAGTNGWYNVKAAIDLLVPDYVKNLWPTENKHE